MFIGCSAKSAQAMDLEGQRSRKNLPYHQVGSSLAPPLTPQPTPSHIQCFSQELDQQYGKDDVNMVCTVRRHVLFSSCCYF